MPRKISRRRFVAGSIRLAAVTQLIQLEQSGVLAQTAPRLGRAEQRTLRAAADVIIPAHGRMPAASAVGAVRYIERIAGADQTLTDLLASGLRAMESQAAATRRMRFDLLRADEQNGILAQTEKADSPVGFFSALRDLVYEAYYTQPQVMKLVGCRFRSGRQRTATLEAFDERQLARVRTMTPLYRDVKS
jgi:hypothetical protein